MAVKRQVLTVRFIGSPAVKERVKNNIMQILFAAFEADPFVKTGGLGDVTGSLPLSIQDKETEIRVILPKHRAIAERWRNKMRPVFTGTVQLGWRNQYCGIEELKYKGVHYYFVDNEYYFYRDAVYGYEDDGERVAFFCRAVLEIIQDFAHSGDFRPEILHCNDWHTALIPVMLRENYSADPIYRNIKTVFTIHNLKYQGQYSHALLYDMLHMAGNHNAFVNLDYDGCLNFMKGGIIYSDKVTTVSPSYAQEIRTSYFGEGLDGILRRKGENLKGILNGIDVKRYDPRKDPHIYETFGANFKNKNINKKALQHELRLDQRADAPLFILISRLVEQKGLDLLAHILEEALQEDIQFVVLGTGEKKYEGLFHHFAWKYGNKMRALIQFDNTLAHKIYAAGDILLMPSKFEPCGISQMIAMRYGTLPLVRETGGLKDSVIPYGPGREDCADGFAFPNYNAHELLFRMKDAAALYRREPGIWQKLMHNAYRRDCSWKKSAQEYKQLYAGLLPREEKPAEGKNGN